MGTAPHRPHEVYWLTSSQEAGKGLKTIISGGGSHGRT